MARLSDCIVVLILVSCSKAVSAVYDESKHTYCAYMDKQMFSKNGELFIGSSTADPVPNSEKGELLANNTIEQCPDELHLCYTLWLVDPKSPAGTLVLKQGCWIIMMPKCDRSECIAESALESKRLPNATRWCCCQGSHCNVNVTDNYVPGADTAQTAMPSTSIFQSPLYDPTYKLRTIVIALSAVFVFAIVIFCVYLVIRRYQLQRQGLGLTGLPLLDALPPATPVYELDNLKQSTLINTGRYGDVWKGSLNDIQVAIKVLRAGQRHLYINERNIYTLPMIEPQHIPQFYGAEERVTLDGLPEYIIVMKYAELGSVQHYLKNNIVDWSKMCRMLHSIAAGVVHLHTQLVRGDKVKPAVAHRDLNSRNILMNSDLTCSICDFGFAMKIERRGNEEIGDQPTLSDVGTIRYMAPEVLDGAVNLRECEASLKQIDVYALGLVFWEIAMRCPDLYQGLPVPEYQLPLQAEVGLHPTFEEMQDIVSRAKTRPLFPDVWKSTNAAIRALKETIEDCWDQDGEARLTANCVEERTIEMAALWEARHKGVTPTINLTLGSSASHVPEGRKTEPVNLPQPPPSSSSAANSSYPRYMPLENSVSGSTTDTLLLSADTSPPPSATTYNALYYSNQWRQRQQLAPPAHQGYNPTVERNTHRSNSDDDVAVHGNSLAPTNPPLTSALLDALADSLHTPLVSSATAATAANTNLLGPAPNAVAVSEPIQPTPKQPNLPVDGSSGQKAKGSFFSRLRRPKTEKNSGNNAGSSSGVNLPFFNRNGAGANSNGSGAAVQPATLDNLVEIRPASMGSALRATKLEPRATEVRLVHGTPVVQAAPPDDPNIRRPNSLGIHGHNYSSALSTPVNYSSPSAAPVNHDGGGGANNVNVKCNLQRAAAVAAAAAAAAAEEQADSQTVSQPVSSSQSLSSDDMNHTTISLQHFCEEGRSGLVGNSVHQC